MLLADCKGRAFTPLRQQLPARAILSPNKASYACAPTPLAFSRGLKIVFNPPFNYLIKIRLYDILYLRNQLNSQVGYFSLRGIIPFLGHTTWNEFDKMQIPPSSMWFIPAWYDWFRKQSEFAFLCANFGWRTFIIYRRYL